jgi:hypothetical protein
MTRVDSVANLGATPDAAVWVHRRRLPVIGVERARTAYLDAREELFSRWPSPQVRSFVGPTDPALRTPNRSMKRSRRLPRS